MIDSITDEQLNIESKVRVNPLPWRGQFSPQLIEQILSALSGTLPKHGACIFDPFVGSGTVLAESIRAGYSCVGTEINPAAAILARTYCSVNYSRTTIGSAVSKIKQLIDELQIGELPLFGSGMAARERLAEEHCRTPKSLYRYLLESALVLTDFSSESEKPLSTEKALRKVLETVESVIDWAGRKDHFCRVLLEDCRDITIDDDSIDAVVTSPPYINVFNYHQQHRKSVERLGWNVLDAARSEIGSNRRNRQNRFLTVPQFAMEISSCFSELKRVCKDSSPIVFVVGRESRVLGTPFFNSDIIAEVAERSHGMPLIHRRERVFTNRFGERIYEDVLLFSSNKEMEQESPRKIITEIMGQSLHECPSHNVELLKDAIDRTSELNEAITMDLSISESNSKFMGAFA